ncbi:hypothetical protein [Hyphomicrobium sp.]|uniref:hypothetical protein n=1 Tax=Hyphomicrobium sp. TaxID=82 RepID=UPI001DA06024|nr:hypothetical protein [Hyphomicrobium sp.]MBY0560438.1 hypothetical protein [Hyphomicrobium sp.]
MRVKSLTALAALVAASAVPSGEVAAWGLDRPDLRPRVYRPDPALENYYSYYYDPRGYYPYYNSGEWGRPIISRYKGPLPPYYASWGAPNRRYYHVEWHRRHYGGHRRGDW